MDDIIREAANSTVLQVVPSTTNFGNKKKVIRLINPRAEVTPETWQKEILDEVIKISSNLNFKELLDLVYSTYPIMSQPKESMLDLTALAQEYQNLQNRRAAV